MADFTSVKLVPTDDLVASRRSTRYRLAIRGRLSKIGEGIEAVPKHNQIAGDSHQATKGMPLKSNNIRGVWGVGFPAPRPLCRGWHVP